MSESIKVNEQEESRVSDEILTLFPTQTLQKMIEGKLLASFADKSSDTAMGGTVAKMLTKERSEIMSLWHKAGLLVSSDTINWWLSQLRTNVKPFKSSNLVFIAQTYPSFVGVYGAIDPRFVQLFLGKFLADLRAKIDVSPEGVRLAPDVLIKKVEGGYLIED